MTALLDRVRARLALDPVAPVDPHLVGTVHQDVGDAGLAEQRLQGSRSGELVDRLAHRDQDVVLTQQAAGLLPDERGHPAL